MTTLSMTTDYLTEDGDPSPYLRRIAAAGFTHLHWCHHWNTDFVYYDVEVEQIERWLSETGLRMLNVHGSEGREKSWYAPEEYRRQAGVALVRNRLEFAARLGSDVVIMHAGEPDPHDPAPFWDALLRSLDELEPLARTLGVRIAVENGSRPQSWEVVSRLLESYLPDFVGLCYDSGHGNMLLDGIARLDALRDRLIAVHLHDNDGASDQHRIPFTGTVGWDQLAGVLARSSYRDMVNIETVMHQTGLTDENAFLAQTYAAAGRVDALIRAASVTEPG